MTLGAKLERVTGQCLSPYCGRYQAHASWQEIGAELGVSRTCVFLIILLEARLDECCTRVCPCKVCSTAGSKQKVRTIRPSPKQSLEHTETAGKQLGAVNALLVADFLASTSLHANLPNPTTRLGLTLARQLLHKRTLS